MDISRKDRCIHSMATTTRTTTAAAAAAAAANIVIDAKLAEEARQLDESAVNRSNILFSRLSMRIANQLLLPLLAAAEKQQQQEESGSSWMVLSSKGSLEEMFTQLAKEWNDDDDSKKKKNNNIPFCCVEGVKYAINAIKVKSIQQEGHIVLTVPFYCEHERGQPASNDNPNGEESPIQKLEECMFLLAYNESISMDLVFVNDSIAEKVDTKDGGSARLFKKAILDYAKTKKLQMVLQKADGALPLDDEDFDCLILMNGRLCVKFTSCETEASKASRFETAQEKRKRMENRDSSNGKLQERKGGAVLTGMELDLPATFVDKPRRVLRCLVDGDSAHPVGSFVGDAAYSILECNNVAYLGNLKHPSTCISAAAAGEESGGVSAGTQARVQNRKLFFSGFIVPFLFPELLLKYNYTGTTQLPIKAFRGDIDFAKAKLKTVQPNVDLGMLALLCSYLNTKGGSIDSGPVTIRDNVASSTMTTDDLSSEWTKTYGPIFTSAVSLCRELKPQEFERLPIWLTSFIEHMELKHYTTLFGEEAASNPDIVTLFSIMQKYKGAEDRDAVLEELQQSFDKIFAF